MLNPLRAIRLTWFFFCLQGGSAAAEFLRRDGAMSAAAAREIVAKCARPMLHARSLGFRHPVTGEEISFAVEPPPDFVDVFTELSKY